MYQEFRGDGLEMVAVNLGEDRQTVEAFVRRMKVPFPVLLDETGRSPAAFGLWGHPNTVLIDRAGRLIGLVRGERDWQSEAARRLVRQLLEEPTGLSGGAHDRRP